jgi:hypothetical protein
MTPNSSRLSLLVNELTLKSPLGPLPGAGFAPSTCFGFVMIYLQANVSLIVTIYTHANAYQGKRFASQLVV